MATKKKTTKPATKKATTAKKAPAKKTVQKKAPAKKTVKKNAEAEEQKVTTLSIADLRPLAKKTGVVMKGKTASKLKEDILDAIEEQVAEAKRKRQGNKWQKENQDLIDFYQQFINEEHADNAPADETTAEAEEDVDQEDVDLEAEVEKTKEKVQAKKKERQTARKEKIQKAKTAKKDTKGKVKKTAELSCYGHRLSSARGVVDELVAKGTTRDNAIKVIMQKCDTDELHATWRFDEHVKIIERKIGIKVNIKGKTYKAERATL